MFNLVQKRRAYFIFSGLLMALGILIMVYSTIQTGSPFRLSIAFVGGSIYEFQFVEEGATETNIRNVFADNGLEGVVIQRLGSTGESFIVTGEFEPSALVEGTRNITEANTAINTQASTDVVYLFEFEDSAPTGQDLQARFGDRTFVLDREDGWSAVTDATETARVEAILNELNESFPLTFERLAGNSVNLTINADDISEAALTAALQEAGIDVSFVQRRPYRWSVRGGFADQQTSDAILDQLNNIADVDASSLRISTVSETVGREVTQAAFLAVAMACVVVTGFIVFAFREVPNALRYGVCAVVAMLHDVMIVAGAMSLMGLLVGWEIDALFLTAVLTVVGFSVQDTIVMFDRVRENIPKHLGEPYEAIVNRSVWETIHRSMGTQLSTFFVIFAILLFGGETIRQFIAILFVGLLSGAYSSLFTAVPLLVAWEKGEIPFLKGDEALVASYRVD